MFIKKFYDADAPDNGVATSEPVSIASLMATKGNVNTTDSFGVIQVEHKETNEEPVTTQEPTPAAPATEATATPQEQKETPATKEAPIFGAKPQVAEPEKSSTTTWQEVLKSQQPDSVLKEMGFDDKMVAFLTHWKNNGDVKEYLKELSTDYATMPSEDVMRHQLRKEYPKANERQLDVLYRNEVIDRYKLDPDVYSEEEIENGKLLLDAKADKYRDDLASNQQKFLIPPPPEKLPVGQDPKEVAAQEARQKQNEMYISTMSNHPYTREVLSTNKITIGEGESAFKFPVDINDVSDMLLDNGKFYEAMYEVKKDAQGNQLSATPKVEHQLLVAAVAKYGKGLFDEMAKHYKALGGKATIEPIENATMPNKNNLSKSVIADDSAAAQMARSGRLVG